MRHQFSYFEQTKKQIAQIIGRPATDDLIYNAIYSFTIGGNDYMNNYLASAINTKNMYTPQQYQDLLINSFKSQIKTGYYLGILKFINSNIGPIGCAPSVSEEVNASKRNNYAVGFNAALKPMLERFTDPVSTACCGVGKYISIDGACRTISRLCPDRAKSVFWDAFHPTKKMNKICNNQFLFGGLHAISPINVKKLLAV
uniref:Uncharacterized protein n=1 Tax=Physcomitrium patens TaxID=3218 RepID=A0A2K1KBR1_PHYPA|nr:GDSL esterase/lipase At5g18430-like [Physcomitrium patens]PNR51216.1 hypothetical protein PHYPA_010402 [Physcomitrium patens]|eukprot:XP_024381174.1 GDSL esterase/lipase At5g18430-like [Physcomitrella patens]